VKPVTVNELNQTGQIDLVDFQSLPDGNFRFVVHYQEHLTKYNLLSPDNKTSRRSFSSIVENLPRFCSAALLQSDNGREFTAEIIG
jgi:hypothetical protein